MTPLRSFAPRSLASLLLPIAAGLPFLPSCSASGTGGKDGSSEPSAGGAGAGGSGFGSTLTLDPGAGGARPTVEPVHATHLVGNVPADLKEKFEKGKASSAPGPSLAYPASETMLPPNLERLLFQWPRGDDDYFHLRLASATSSLDIYSDGQAELCAAKSASIACFQASAETLQPFGKAVAGTDVEVTLSGLGKDGSVHAAKPIVLHFGPTTVDGAIYYWSTNEEGVRRTKLNEELPYNYLVPETFATKEAPAGQCVACHTLSRSGKYMAFAFPGDRLGVVEVTEDLPPLIVAPPGIGNGSQFVAASWSAFSPDDKKLIVAGEGHLNIHSASTGAHLADVTIPEGKYASMPDWSPDGTKLAFALHANPDLGKRTRHLTGSSIALLSGKGTAFSNLVLVAEPKTTSETLAYPMFSPDSRWLVYARAGSSSEEDPTSEIVISEVGEEKEPVPLTRANTAVASGPTSGLMNNMPTWAPSGDTRILWIAFSTKRDFGLLTSGDANRKQLWIAGIDTTKLGKGDASFPAFRLEGQSLTENNHRPFWAVDVLPEDWVPPPLPVVK